MSQTALRMATYQDLLDLPDHVVGEIIAGELIVSPRPAIPHASAASELGGDLIAPFRRGRGGPGGWRFFDEPELHFGADVLVPDIAGWRRERMPRAPDTAFITMAPDWVCEVLSPRTCRTDRLRKMPIYAREGVGWIWLLDPLERTLEVYRRQDQNWLLIGTWGDDAVVSAEPFDAVPLAMAPWWGDDEPPKEG